MRLAYFQILLQIMFSIVFEDPGTHYLQIINQMGQVKLAKQLNSTSAILDMIDWPSGVYFVVINGLPAARLILNK